MEYEVFVSDLNQDAQIALCEAMGYEPNKEGLEQMIQDNNWDVFPFASGFIEPQGE